MRIKELFEKADYKKIARSLAENAEDININNTNTEEEKDIEREALRLHIESCYQKMLADNTDCPDQNMVIVCTKCVDLDDGAEYLDASLFHLEDLKKEIYIADYDDSESECIPLEEFERKYVQVYSFEFTPWAEILGSYVANISIREYGLDEVAKAIYDEMTFFGYEQETQEETADEEAQIITERIAEVEGHPERWVTWETVRKEMEEKYGWEPETPEEAEERHQRTLKEMKINQNERVRIMRAVKREFRLYYDKE
ncbi:MAG: hypothetical protein LUE86_07585 [Clostridiales bacterium]|nr:hypothetical protein [Clostridiales bacterium]